MSPTIRVGSRWKYIGPTRTKFYTSGQIYTVRREVDDDGMFVMDDNRNSGEQARHHWNLSSFVQKFVAADDAALPVRTVTRMEIVPGVYGAVQITKVYPDGVNIYANSGKWSASDLRAAARVFVSAAEALEEST